MDSIEPLTEQEVISMMKSLDRYESFVTMFSDSLKDPINDPLNELLERLGSLFARSTSLETQERVIRLLVVYMRNPLNNRRTTTQLFSGVVQILSLSEAAAMNSGARLLLSAFLNDDNGPHPTANIIEFVEPVLAFLDLKTIKDIFVEVIQKVSKPPPKRNVAGVHVGKVSLELKRLFQVLMDHQVPAVPILVLVQELSKQFPNKSFEDVELLRTRTPFFASYQLLSKIISIQDRHLFFPVIGYSLVTGSLWSIDQHSLCFIAPPGQLLAGISKKQAGLVQYVIEQCHSRHTYQAIFGLSKGHDVAAPGLEDQLVEVMLQQLQGDNDEVLSSNWQRISSQFVSMGICGFVGFNSVIEKFEAALQNIDIGTIRLGRFYFMFAIYQFVAMQASAPIRDFIGCVRLFDDLFPDTEVFPASDLSQKYDVIKLGPAYLWAHMSRRAAQEKIALPCTTPICLARLLESISKAIDKIPRVIGQLFLGLDHAMTVNCFVNPLPGKDQLVFSKMDYTDKMANSLITHMTETYPTHNPESIVSANGTAVLKSQCNIPVDVLDVLSSHIKMVLCNSMTAIFLRLVTTPLDPSGIVPSLPAFWETNARLLLYEETESTIFTYLARRLPEMAFKNRAWFVLAADFEVLSFRTPYIPINWKSNLLVMALTVYKELASQGSQPCLPHVWVHLDQTILRILQSYNVDDFYQPRNYLYENRNLISTDAEEVTRLLLLNTIRLSNVMGLDHVNMQHLINHINAVQAIVPHTWSPHIMSTLPTPVQALYTGVGPFPARDKQQLRRIVEETVQRLRAATNDADIRTALLTQQPMPVFYCIIWRQLLDNTDPLLPFKSPALVAGIIDKMGIKGQMQSIRVLVEHVVYEMSTSKDADRVTRLIESLGMMIWKYGMMPVDRVILVLLMRSFDTVADAQVAMVVVQLLLKSSEFALRLTETVNNLPVNYWEHDNYFEKVVAYHQKFPEPYYFNGALEFMQQPQVNHPRLPVYLSNAILRCVPVLDIAIHRHLEVPKFHRNLESLLDLVARMFRYHDRPVTFLWQTLHYYDSLVQENLPLRRKLFRTVIVSKGHHFYPANFYYVSQFEAYLVSPTPDAFQMQPEFFTAVVERLVICMYNHNMKSAYPRFDWRYHEFPNATTHALYTGCLQLMCISGGAEAVVEGLLNVLRKRFSPLETQPEIPAAERAASFQKHLNCVGLFLSALPNRYFGVLLRLLETVVKSPELSSREKLDVDSILSSGKHAPGGFLLQLFHATLLHNGGGQLLILLEFFRNTLVPVVCTEAQLMFVFGLVTPLLGKIAGDGDRLAHFVSDVFALITRVVSKTVLQHPSLVSDVLYHIVDSFHVNLSGEKLEEFLRSMPPDYKKSLRFLSAYVGERI